MGILENEYALRKLYKAGNLHMGSNWYIDPSEETLTECMVWASGEGIWYFKHYTPENNGDEYYEKKKTALLNRDTIFSLGNLKMKDEKVV